MKGKLNTQGLIIDAQLGVGTIAQLPHSMFLVLAYVAAVD